MATLPCYALGQRWASLAEPELGLGKIVFVDRRFVEVAFEGNNSTRKYGAGSAPLTRVILKAGDAITVSGKTELIITSVDDEDATKKVTYVCGDVRVPEDAVTFAESGAPAPIQRLLRAMGDRCEDFVLRMRLLEMQAEILRSPVRGFCGGRMQLLPHQLFIASEVSSRRRVRVLLADETGLGKTIEACCILHRLILTGKVRRCLICVPESLVHQWFIELLRRFNLMFRLFTPEHFESLRGSTNPFQDDQFGIISMDLLAGDHRLLKNAEDAGWDLVIVDEAHHVREGTKEYDCVRRLSEKSAGLILLTATPEQSGRREQFFRLLDCLGMGRAMFRTTRREITGFPRRVVHIEPLRMNESMKSAINDEYRRIVSNQPPQLSPVSKDNPRVAWLVDLLKTREAEKFLVLCALKEKAVALKDALQDKMKIDIAVFHEDMTLIQRDRNAAWFTEKNGARVLIASEIGSEGRNFQCCKNLVLFDLPLEPEVLEQRIGRLDRIGQGAVIHIFVPFAVDTHEETLCRWYHEGLNMFEKNVPAASITGEAVRESLIAIIKGDRADADRNDALVRETGRLCSEFTKTLQEGSDLTPEIAPFEPDRALAIKDAIHTMQENRISEKVMLLLFKHYGVLVEDADNGKWLLMTEYVTDRRFPLPRQERPLITFEREIALQREDIEFISIDHPMVTDALDLFFSSDFGTSVFALGKGLGIGDVLLESLFVLECVAPENLNTARFLPPTPIRVVVDQSGACVELDKACSDVSHDKLQSIVAVLEETVPPMQKAALSHATQMARPLIGQALSAMRRSLDAEQERLRIIRSVDRSFLDQEAQLCAQEKEALEKYLAEARVRLDSIRVIMRETGDWN
jgi:ATP-dependent helicase HepA